MLKKREIFRECFDGFDYEKIAAYGDADIQRISKDLKKRGFKYPDPATILCHRVVNAKGERAGEYAFGGVWKQDELLEEECVEAIEAKVDLSRFEGREV